MSAKKSAKILSKRDQDRILKGMPTALDVLEDIIHGRLKDEHITKDGLVVEKTIPAQVRVQALKLYASKVMPDVKDMGDAGVPEVDLEAAIEEAHNRREERRKAKEYRERKKAEESGKVVPIEKKATLF